MTYTLRLKDITIGWCDLEARDPSTRIARGDFRPGLGYELVEPIFVLRPTDAIGPDALERESRYRRARQNSRSRCRSSTATSGAEARDA